MESCRDHLMVRVKTEVHADSKSQVQEEGRSESAKNDDPVSSRPPSPKYLPPKPPDNPQTIAQGRHQRFQAKKRYFHEFHTFFYNLISLLPVIYKHKFFGSLILVHTIFCLTHPHSCPVYLINVSVFQVLNSIHILYLRVVVGNTYQYLPPHASNEAGDALRYKWQVYVRAPTQADDISSFISAVTFILDQSYAPHHIITLK